MAREGSRAPKERINITYKTKRGDAIEEIELPLKILMLGDFLGRQDTDELSKRSIRSINKDNFSKVMAAQKLSLDLSVENRLKEEDNNNMGVKLEINGLKDFTPEGIAAQVPELKKLMELRASLEAIKAPVLNNKGNIRRKIQAMLKDADSRARWQRERDPKN